MGIAFRFTLLRITMDICRPFFRRNQTYKKRGLPLSQKYRISREVVDWTEERNGPPLWHLFCERSVIAVKKWWTHVDVSHRKDVRDNLFLLGWGSYISCHDPFVSHMHIPGTVGSTTCLHVRVSHWQCVRQEYLHGGEEINPLIYITSLTLSFLGGILIYSCNPFVKYMHSLRSNGSATCLQIGVNHWTSVRFESAHRGWEVISQFSLMYMSSLTPLRVTLSV